MIRFSLLGSGSSGNAMLVCSAQSKILIDDGLSFRKLEERAASLGESLHDLAAVFITHEHGDHVNGVGVLARKLGISVYMTHGTLANLPSGVGKIPDVHGFDSGDAINIDDMTISSFSVPHDAHDPVSYTIRSGDCQLGIASDLGKVSHLVRTQLAGSHALVLESNYCPEMLRMSSYPAAIRQRIKSSDGHLSNHDMNSLLSSLMHDELRLVVAVHVSQENNTEKLALDLAQKTLGRHRAKLVIAQQDSATPLFNIMEMAC